MLSSLDLIPLLRCLYVEMNRRDDFCNLSSYVPIVRFQALLHRDLAMHASTIDNICRPSISFQRLCYYQRELSSFIERYTYTASILEEIRYLIRVSLLRRSMRGLYFVQIEMLLPRSSAEKHEDTCILMQFDT